MQSFYYQLKKWVAWFQFDRELRIEAYSALQLLLDNQVQLNHAIQLLCRVYTGKEAKPTHPIALALMEASSALEQGMTFSEGLKHWLPEEEFRLLYAGEISGQLSVSLKEIAQLMEAKGKISDALISGLAYPAVLFLLSGGLLYMVSSQVVPKLVQVVDPSKWTGSIKLLREVSNIVSNYGLWIIATLLVMIGVMIFSFSRWVGKLRIYADKFPPWSVYRMIQGSSFLLNLSSLLSSGLQINSALQELGEHASPWLRERLLAIRSELAKGRNFGEALISSGYEFPDPKSNRFLAVISEYSGLERAMKDVGQRWLEEGIKNIQTSCNIASVVGIVIVGSVMILVVLGAGGLQNALQVSNMT